MDVRICQARLYVIVLFTVLIRSVNVQFMPMFPSPMFAMPPMPPPLPAMMSVVIKVPSQPKSTTTITPVTTLAPKKQNGVAIAIPVPMAIPLQVAFPAQPPPSFCTNKPRPPSCPPCPPCVCSPTCTPAFFSYCSPCHKKCRCRDPKDAPVPQPPVPPMPASGPAYAFPMPSSALVVPMPPLVKANPYKDSCSDESKASCDDSSSSSCSTERRRNKQIRHSWKQSKKRHHYRKQRKRTRRNFHTMKTRDFDDDELIKPVLSFINRRGDVKINRKLTKADAAQLMRDSLEIEKENQIYDQVGNLERKSNDMVQNVRVWTNQDAKKKTQLTVESNYKDKDEDGHVEDFRKNNRKMVLRDGGSKIESEIVKEGRKELVFKPSEDKTISNLSLSFQVV